MAEDKKKSPKDPEKPEVSAQKPKARSNAVPDFTKSENSDYKVKYDF